MRETSASEPLRTHRNLYVTSKLEPCLCSRKSVAGTYLLAMWCPVYRRRDSHSGSRMELENLVGDAKGKGASGTGARRCPVFWAPRMHAIVPRRRHRAASKQRNSGRRASPRAPVSFGSRRHARYRWRPSKQQRLRRRVGEEQLSDVLCNAYNARNT